MACRRARSMTVKKIVEVPAREAEAEQGSDINGSTAKTATPPMTTRANRPCLISI